MNIYDFDNTIYKGDSTADFIKWAIRKKPSLSLKLIRAGIPFINYRTGHGSKTEFKEKMYSFLQKIPDIDAWVEEFWDKHIKNIKPWYFDLQQNDDAIISASPDFLVRPACRRLGITNLMASEVDKTTGFYLGINCFGEEKVRRLRENYQGEIDKFYSDSLSDEPLARLAKQAYLVCGDTIINW